MDTVNCPVCNHTCEASGGDRPCCPLCGADLNGSAAEKKQMEAPGTFTTEDKQFFGKMSTNATLYLTDRRLVAIPGKLEGFGLTSALTAAVVNKMTNEYGIVSIPLEQIKAVRDGKFGLLAKALVIETADGGLLKITVPKQKQWKEAITNAAPALR